MAYSLHLKLAISKRGRRGCTLMSFVGAARYDAGKLWLSFVTIFDYFILTGIASWFDFRNCNIWTSAIKYKLPFKGPNERDVPGI